MARTVPARSLALLALLGAVAAVALVVSSAGGGSGGGTGASTPSDVTGSATSRDDAGTTTPTTGAGEDGSDGPRFYTVQDGDVLSAIADETGVPLARIEELNPDLDAQTLQNGQRIKLRP